MNPSRPDLCGWYLYAATQKRTLGGKPDPNDATSGVVYRIEPAE